MNNFDTVLLLPNVQTLKYKDYLPFKNSLEYNDFSLTKSILDEYNNKSDISLIKINRSEYSVGTGESNLHNKQIRFFEDKYYSLYGFHFYNSDDGSEKWCLQEKELFINTFLDIINKNFKFILKASLCKMFDIYE